MVGEGYELPKISSSGGGDGMKPSFISVAVDSLVFLIIETALSHNSCLLNLTLATPSSIDFKAQATATLG